MKTWKRGSEEKAGAKPGDAAGAAARRASQLQHARPDVRRLEGACSQDRPAREASAGGVTWCSYAAGVTPQLFSGDTIIDCEDGCGVLCVECFVPDEIEGGGGSSRGVGAKPVYDADNQGEGR